jgi:hypothetical protein
MGYTFRALFGTFGHFPDRSRPGAEKAIVARAMRKRTLNSPNFWIALVLLVANGVAWVHALAPEGPAFAVEPHLAPDLADVRQRLVEGGHSGEPFAIEITDQEAAETLAWYLARHPNVPFREPQVSVTADSVVARGVAEIAGLRLAVEGKARIELEDGVPIVTLEDLDVAGIVVPGLVRDGIQAQIDDQFALAQDLPIIVDELVLEEGRATVRGTIR